MKRYYVEYTYFKPGGSGEVGDFIYAENAATAKKIAWNRCVKESGVRPTRLGAEHWPCSYTPHMECKKVPSSV